MLDFNKYKNKMPYPTPPAKPYLKKAADPAEIRAYADQVEDYQKSEDTYREAMRQYHNETHRLFVQFIADVLAENGLAGHPKADKVFQLASAAASGSNEDDELKETAHWVAGLADLVLK